jgi:GTP-binding protein
MASRTFPPQDQQLAGLLREHTKSVILVINKWDKAEGNEDSFRNDVKEVIYGKFPHLKFAPIVFTSAKSGYKIHQIFPFIFHAHEARLREIDEATLREFMKRATKRHAPVKDKGVRHPKILGFKQITVNPPRFEMFIKSKTSVHMSYVHYLMNRLREEFDFFATPIVIKLTKMKK